MGKQEFLDKLRLALNGRVSGDTVADALTYYEDYISAEVRKGKSEEGVMSTLGDPRLIARTIIETKGGENSEPAQEYGGDKEAERHPRSIPGWVWLIVMLVAVVVVLSVVFKIISVLFPFIAIIVLVSFLVKFFRDWAN